MQKADLILKETISRVNRDRPGGHFSWSKKSGKWWRRHDRKIARRQQKAIATEAIDIYYREVVPVMDLEAALDLIEAEWERELLHMYNRALIEEDDLAWEEAPPYTDEELLQSWEDDLDWSWGLS